MRAELWACRSSHRTHSVLSHCELPSCISEVTYVCDTHVRAQLGEKFVLLCIRSFQSVVDIEGKSRLNAARTACRLRLRGSGCPLCSDRPCFVRTEADVALSLLGGPPSLCSHCAGRQTTTTSLSARSKAVMVRHRSSRSLG